MGEFTPNVVYTKSAVREFITGLIGIVGYADFEWLNGSYFGFCDMSEPGKGEYLAILSLMLRYSDDLADFLSSKSIDVQKKAEDDA